MKKIFFIIWIFFFINGCAINQTSFKKTCDALESEINILTLDEAIKKWGDPKFAIQKGNLFIVTWQNEKHWENIVPPVKILYALPIVKGWEIRGYFDKDTKKMLHYNYRVW